MVRKYSKKAVITDYLSQFSNERLESEIKEYEYRRKERFSNRMLFFGSIFESKADVELARKILKRYKQ